MEDQLVAPNSPFKAAVGSRAAGVTKIFKDLLNGGFSDPRSFLPGDRLPDPVFEHR